MPDDFLGTLTAYVPIKFDGSNNTVDAALAASTAGDLGNSTLPTGYGTPSSAILACVDDACANLLSQAVQKFGRTTALTTGAVAEVNVTINVCYQPIGRFCAAGKVAKFVKQLGISPGSFSAGGDSGSLIVTNDGNKWPVGLLFAGGSTRTYANRIDLVLALLSNSSAVVGTAPISLQIDDSTEPGPPPTTGSVSGTVTDASDSSAIVGATVSVDTGQSATTASDGTYAISDVPTGVRTVTASASGYQSQVAQDTVNDGQITSGVNFALTPASDTVSVDSITYATEGGRLGDKHLNVTVALVDDLGNPVGGASVSIALYRNGSLAATGTGTTGSNGTVTFSLKNAASGCYKTVVTSVVASGLTWDGVTPENSSLKPGGGTC